MVDGQAGEGGGGVGVIISKMGTFLMEMIVATCHEIKPKNGGNMSSKIKQKQTSYNSCNWSFIG